MKIVWLVLIIGGFVTAGFWYITETDRADRAENYRRQQEQQAKDEARQREQEELQRADDERIRKERAAALAKRTLFDSFSITLTVRKCVSKTRRRS